MSQSLLVSSPAEPAGPADPSATRLSGRWLVLARAGWVLVVTYTLVLQQRASALSKAEKIAGIIDVWHREYARHETC